MKIKKTDLLNLVREQADVIQKLSETVSAHHADIIRIEKVLDVKFCTPEPKLNQLDQSVFSHPYVDDRFNYVALNADGQSIFFEQKPSVSVNLDIWVATGGSIMPMLKGYDTSDWQNSLIEREKVELTGSDLCRAMLARGDVCVPCFTSWDGDAEAIADKSIWLVHQFLPEEPNFHAGLEDFYFAVPINTRTGEPLTQSDVGL
ncbi:hypothetical protein ACTXLJ_05615 [Psychrobacter celer]|uniref:hypothetical protein n=1 Tax=Psychrobacter celer TaxID=306572 RepID=UPI003FD31071